MNTPYTEWRGQLKTRFLGRSVIQTIDELELFIESLLTSRDTYWKERVEELELSCIDDRLLGKSDEYLEGYNTSTERWREKRDTLLDNLK